MFVLSQTIMYRLLLIVFVIAVLNSCNTGNRKEEFVKLRIIETTDVHGSFFPEDLVRQKKAGGSLAQAMTYLRQQREIKGQEVVLLDNGDILQGTPIVYYANYIDTQKVHELAQIMNFMHYDASSVGNHDIEASPRVYEKLRKQIDFPYLAANAIDSLTKKAHFQPYTILNRKGVKIAVLGMITPSIPNWLPEKLWPGMYFDDMIETAQYWVSIIKEKEKPDLIIGLFHAGVDANYGGGSVDEKRNENASLLVAKRVAGFDVVFAGHDHKPLSEFVINIAGDSVLILNAGAHAHNLAIANIELKLDIQSNTYKKVLLGSIENISEIKPDSIFMQKFGSYFDQVKTYMNSKVVELDTSVYAEEALYGPSAFVDLIHQIQLDVSGADISFAAPFSTNAILKKGPLYMRDMFKLYRYENFLCTLKLTGKEVKDFLEFSANLWFDTIPNANNTVLLLKDDGKKDRYGLPLKNAYYNFDSGAGIKYSIDLRKARGERVRIISMTDGSIFDDAKMYKVVMNSYRANGGGNHLFDGAGLTKVDIKNRMIHCSDEDFRMILTNWLQEHGHYMPNSLNNWKLITQ